MNGRLGLVLQQREIAQVETVGYQTMGHCKIFVCPWTLDVDVDFIGSVFDSLFLELEYRHVLDQIGFVPGLAASIKASLGPLSIVGEWNSALRHASFSDDLGPVRILPSAWQVSIGYQFDWNPRVESIGAQGTYIAFSYSQSRDLAGITRVIDSEATRVGAVPRERYLVHAGEWVLDGLRFAVEYSHVVDYPVSTVGTGRSANGFVGMLTYEW